MNLGRKGKRQEQDADVDAHHARTDAGQLRYRNTGGVGRVGYGAEQAGQQVAKAVRVHRSLHRTVIHGPVVSPGHPLDGHGVTHGFDSPHHGNENERRQQCPERRSEPQVPAGEARGGNSHPGRFDHPRPVVEAEQAGNDAAARHAGHRRPETKMAPPAHDDANDDGQGDDRTHRPCRPRGVGWRLRQHAENDGHDGDGDQHDDGAADDGRDDATQPGKTPGEEKLEQRGYDDERCQQGRAALDQGGHAHGDERPGGAHQQDVAGTDVPDSTRLDERRRAADKQRRERRPRKKWITQPGGSNHYCGREHDAGDGEDGVLQSEAKGQGARWILVRLVADLRGRGHRFASSLKMWVMALEGSGVCCDGAQVSIQDESQTGLARMC